ncbi:hypothetical protein BD410DRAFT_793184 [Rickenella mellea]|uniref:DUF6589 domain-containing protein n=1 Tax=Rickenella mellea TaxID=50990 RepID=A0A4Y7PUD7_9AGAM|nr:hypothetical protein BD410DRAFT_793184 [Rickenella mellea]
MNTVSMDERGQLKLAEWRPEERRQSAIDLVLREITAEMESAKKSFQMRVQDVTPDFIPNFDLEAVSTLFRSQTPLLRAILFTSSRTARAEAENTLKNQEISCTVLESQIFRLRSANGLLYATAFSQWLHSNGASRQTIDMLSKFGLSISFDSVRSAHEALAERMLSRARDVARGPHVLGYDNIQINMSIHVEQRHLAPPKVQSGTTSIIYGLRNASPEAIRLKPILKRRAECHVITYATDVRPTRLQQEKINNHLVLDIIETFLSNHPSFKLYESHGELKHPTYRPPPSNYKTSEHVLQTTTINESTTDGNIEVVRNIYLDQLQLTPSDLEEVAIPLHQ